MANLKIGQKPARVLKFMMGVRHPHVTNRMAAFGFTEADLQEAWSRMEAVTRSTLTESAPTSPDPKLVQKLDDFENVWFAVAKASLASRYPDVHSALFAKLPQATGRDVAITVRTFLGRLREMETGAGAFAENGPEARALLAERGLSETIVDDAAGLALELEKFAKVDNTATGTKEQQEAAIAHLWDWYLEWGAIARIAVKDRRYLKAMGFLTGKKGGDDSDSDSDSDSETEASLADEENNSDAETSDALEVEWNSSNGEEDTVAAE